MTRTFDHVARQVAPAGHWAGPPLDSVTLDYDARFRRRVVLAGDAGTRVLLDLAGLLALEVRVEHEAVLIE